MLTSKDLLERVDEIVERSYTAFLFDLIGEDFFTTEQQRQVESLGVIIGRRPLIELIYILVRQRSTPGYKKDVTLNRLLAQVAATGVLPVINDAHRYSIQHAKAQINEAITATQEELKKKIKQLVLKHNNEYKNELSVTRIVSIPDQSQKIKKEGNLLLNAIGAIAIGAGFVKAFTVALTNLANNAAIDSATLEAGLGLIKKDPIVFKEPVRDAKLCRWCRKFYLNSDGSPKEYKLSELQQNGSNEGLPKSEWKATVLATHPHCRCQLQYKK